jgi:threonine dehydratase
MIPVPADHEGRRTKSGSVRLPGIEDAMAAASRIAGQVRQSPLLPLPGEDDIRLKLEVLQPTGSFKVRGVFNWALSLDPAEREAGFLTFSAGNTALALGHAARLFGVKARSILPDSAPRYKVGALRSAGVEPTLMGFGEMMDWVDAEGWHGEPQVFLHPWVDSRMIAGHATRAGRRRGARGRGRCGAQGAAAVGPRGRGTGGALSGARSKLRRGPAGAG